MQKSRLRIVGSGAACAEDTKTHAINAVAKHRGEPSLSDLERRVAELRDYKREEHEESFIWEPRVFNICGFKFTCGSRRVPMLGTVARRLFK